MHNYLEGQSKYFNFCLFGLLVFSLDRCIFIYFNNHTFLSSGLMISFRDGTGTCWLTSCNKGISSSKSVSAPDNNRCGTVVADNIFYAKFRKSLLAHGHLHTGQISRHFFLTSDQHGGWYLGPKLHPGGGFFEPWFFIILKNSHLDLSNEGSNFILSSPEVGHWVAQT